MGAVARVEYEPDMQRNCHNLSNMRVQLQNLLDGRVAPQRTTGRDRPSAAGAPPTAAKP